MPKPILLEVMKARAGIPTNDLFAMLWAQKIRARASSVQTLTGIPPLSFKSNGKPLISWSMLGNGQQTGTPTPDNPVMPTFCGVRTGNLFDVTTLENGIYLAANGNKYGNATNGVRAGVKIKASPNTAYTLSAQSSENVSLRIFEWSNGTFTKQTPKYNISGSVSLTVTTEADTTEIAFNIEGENGQYATNIMLNLGSTALPYEPYGWAEKITCAGQTVPVYLGQTQTVRRIGKIDLASLTWSLINNRIWICRNVPNIKYTSSNNELGNGMAEKYVMHEGSGMSTATNCIAIDVSQISVNNDSNTVKPTGLFWYVLAEPETGIVNEPLAKIGDYADELHSTDAGVSIPTAKGQNTLTVETDLQPSEMTITFKG